MSIFYSLSCFRLVTASDNGAQGAVASDNYHSQVSDNSLYWFYNMFYKIQSLVRFKRKKEWFLLFFFKSVTVLNNGAHGVGKYDNKISRVSEMILYWFLTVLTRNSFWFDSSEQ